MPANTLLSGLTGQRYSGCFLYMAHRFPSANIFHSGISRPAISRRPHLSLQSKFQPFVCDNFSSRRLRRRSQSYGFQPFAFFFYFFLFFCSLFFLFFFASFCFFAFFHILYHPIYRIFIFPYFFCGFLHEKTGRITAAGKSGVIDGRETQSTSGEGEHRFTESFGKFLCKFFCVFFCHITLNGNLIHPGVPG